MTYKVIITYTGVEKNVDKLVAPICRMFGPSASYTDFPAYDGTTYDTNVAGFGNVDMPEPYASTSIPFPVPLAQFKLAVVGKNNKVEFEVDDYKEAFYYMGVGAAIAEQGFKVEVRPVIEGLDYISDEASFQTAIADETINAVTLTGPLAVTGETQIAKAITFDGDGNAVTTDAEGKVFTFTAGADVKNVTVKSTADNTEWHSSYGMQFYTGNATVEDCAFRGGNAAIIVNGATVTLGGTIDVSGNTFGGIEVSKGVGESLAASVLNINGATLINTTEEYGKPTVWVDGETDDVGVVNGAENMTMIIFTKEDGNKQKHYYLNPENAVAPAQV